MRISLILLVLASLHLPYRQEQVAPTKTDLANAPLVKIEELLVNPQSYDGKIVRVDGLWQSGYHGAFICPKERGPKCIEVIVDYPFESEQFQEMKKVLDSNLQPGPTGELWDMSARVSVVGRFRDTGRQHRNKPQFALRVMRIEAATPNL